MGALGSFNRMECRSIYLSSYRRAITHVVELKTLGPGQTSSCLQRITMTTTELSTSPAPKGPIMDCNPVSARPFGILEFSGDELRDFLRALDSDWTKPMNRNFELLEAIHRIFDEEVECERLPAEYLPSLKRTVEVVGGMAGDLFYNYHPFELKVQVGVYTTIATEIDDLCVWDRKQMVPAIQRFLASWVEKGSGPHHPLLVQFLRITTTGLPKFFGPMTMANIIHSTTGFLAGCLIEAAYPQGVPCPPSSPRYPMYLRTKTGASEVYAHLIFPESMFPEAEYFEIYLSSIPDQTEFINMTNDILSFYKESVVGTEQHTYLMELAKVLGRNPVDVWRDTCRRTIEVRKDIAMSLGRREELLKAWESFVAGFCAFHYTQHKRYRLAEIGLKQCDDGE